MRIFKIDFRTEMICPDLVMMVSITQMFQILAETIVPGRLFLATSRKIALRQYFSAAFLEHWTKEMYVRSNEA